MITTNLTGNLGNHMWQYAVCRTIAEAKGFDWGINPSPTHDYHRGMNQMYFMNVDFGKPVIGINRDFHEKWITYQHNGEIVNITMMDKDLWNISDNTRLLGHNGAFGGIFQSEKYFDNNSDRVKKWFTINQEYYNSYQKKLSEMNIELNDDLCVINFRGGEYRSIPKIVCRKEYWSDSINHMLSLNSKMKFLIITDDISYAKSFMPFDIPAHHVDIGFDFYVVNQSKWTIISNSTFGWWAAWLNEKSNKIIAPKYFGAHNFSDGFWGVGEIYSKPFQYMGRDGVLYDYENCKKEAYEYYLSKKIITNENL